MDKYELTQQVHANFGTMKRTGLAHYNEATRSLGISMPQAEVLHKIGESQPINFKQLAEELQLTPGSVTQTVDGLLQDNLVARTLDDRDRRISSLSLTPKGEEKLKDLKDYRSQRLTQLADSLTEAELLELLRIQKKIIESRKNLKAYKKEDI